MIVAIKLIGIFWYALRARAPLSPEIQSALEAVEREGLIVGQKQLLSGAVDLMVWIGTHRKQLIAAVELVFSAVQEAEGFFTLSGSEKKRMRATWSSLYWMI